MSARLKGEIIFDRYEVVRELGKGAMGAVYLVRDPRLGGSLWAFKELEVSLILESERPEVEALFQREMHLLSGFHHPGIPRVLHIYDKVDQGLAFLMEWVDGVALDEVQDSLGRTFLAHEALPISMQVCEVLHYLHLQTPPVVFRDLKPSNLMITPAGRIFFIDFGIARRHKPGGLKDTQELGTPGYCAPEQYGHGQTTPASDLYAAGTTLFHLLTGRDPQSFNFQFPPSKELGVEPESLSLVLDRCLKIKPDERYPSAQALLRDLEEVWRQLTPGPNGATQALGLARLRFHPRPTPASGGKSLWDVVMGLVRLWR
ncbi:serine/threonine protein kinase [bacterium]|nr:serine/threonine protein kinase [bacterium]